MAGVIANLKNTIFPNREKIHVFVPIFNFYFGKNGSGNQKQRSQIIKKDRKNRPEKIYNRGAVLLIDEFGKMLFLPEYIDGFLIAFINGRQHLEVRLKIIEVSGDERFELKPDQFG